MNTSVCAIQRPSLAAECPEAKPQARPRVFRVRLAAKAANYTGLRRILLPQRQARLLFLEFPEHAVDFLFQAQAQFGFQTRHVGPDHLVDHQAGLLAQLLVLA